MFTLILPFYNGDWEKLALTLPAVLIQADSYKVTEIILAHNGLPMRPECLSFCQTIAKDDERVRWAHTSVQGIGAGYKLGISLSRQEFVVLSASDLPFGWTDIQSFLKLSDVPFAIGSKLHAQSVIESRTWKRKLATRLFYEIRRIALGRSTPLDSQGTLIIARVLAEKLAQQSCFDSYLCSLEFATLALARGVAVTELPVTLKAELGASAVSLLHDGPQMLRDILRLRRRMQKNQSQRGRRTDRNAF